MDWMVSLENGAKSFGAAIEQPARWVWNNTPLVGLTWGVLKLGVNTGFQVLAQAQSLRTAIPALFSHHKTLRVLDGIRQVLTYDVAPILAMHGANNYIQNYYREGVQPAQDWYEPYALFLSGLTVVDYAVRAITWRMAPRALVRTTILESVAPLAFNAAVPKKESKICDEKCASQPLLSSMLRSPLILIGNEIALYFLRKVPYMEYPAYLLGLVFYSQFILRSVTPEVCMDHKADVIPPETTLSLVITTELMNKLIVDYALGSIMGPLPYVYDRTLRHFVLLFFTNLAAHMALPTDTTSFDPFKFYDQIQGHISNVITHGLDTYIPIVIEKNKNKTPIITLPEALQFAIKILKTDLVEVKKKPEELTLLNKTMQNCISLCIPALFHSIHNATNDPVIAPHWSSVRTSALNTLGTIKTIGNAKTTATLAWAPNAVAKMLNFLFGLPEGLIRVFLIMSKEKDCLDFVDAFHTWFERNNVDYKVTLAKDTNIVLHGDKPLQEVDSSPQETPLPPPPKQFLTTRTSDRTIDASRFAPRSGRGIQGVASGRYGFLTQRKPTINAAQEVAQVITDSAPKVETTASL